MKKSIAPVWLGVTVVACALWPQVSLSADATAATTTSQGAVAPNTAQAQSKANKESNKKQQVKDAPASTSKDANASDSTQMPVSIAKRVDDFSVEVLEPNLNRPKGSDNVGMQVLHAESHFTTEIPDEATNEAQEKGSLNAVAQSVVPAEQIRRNKVVTGAQQELQAAASAFGFAAKVQERRTKEAEAVMQKEKLLAQEEEKARAQKLAQEAQAKAEAEAKAQALAKVQAQQTEDEASKADESKSIVVATQDAEVTKTPKANETSEVSAPNEEVNTKATTKEPNLVASKVAEASQGEAQPTAEQTKVEVKAKTTAESKVQPEALAQAEASKTSVKSITQAELERLFPMPPKPQAMTASNDASEQVEANLEQELSKVDLLAHAGVFHVKPGTGTYRLTQELYKAGQGYTQDQFLTALFRRNPDKFGPRGPLYPFENVDLIVPTVAQIQLEKNGVFASYLSQPGVKLAVKDLPRLGVANKTSNQAKLKAQKKQYEKACREVTKKREAYLKARGFTISDNK